MLIILLDLIMIKFLILTSLFITSIQANASSSQEIYNQLEIDFSENIYFNNENINLHRDGTVSPYIKEVSPDYEVKNGRPLNDKQVQMLPAFEFIKFDIFEKAYKGYLKIKKSGLVKKEILTIVDYTLHHEKRRLFVLDLKNKKVLFNTWTQHGFGSDPQRTGNATDFSNIPNSEQTSLGFILTQETYRGMWGYSMRLKGLDTSLNSKVRSRAIVMHGAGSLYAEIATYGNMGLSAGCITLPIYESGKFYGLKDRSLNEIIINKVKNGSIIFSYSDKNTFSESKWLK